jgi:hypothetical protein
MFIKQLKYLLQLAFILTRSTSPIFPLHISVHALTGSIEALIRTNSVLRTSLNDGHNRFREFLCHIQTAGPCNETKALLAPFRVELMEREATLAGAIKTEELDVTAVPIPCTRLPMPKGTLPIPTPGKIRLTHTCPLPAESVIRALVPIV